MNIQWMRTMILVALLLLSGVAFGTDVTLTWSWPDTYCADGQGNVEPLLVTDISAAEVYIATTSIPRVPGSCGPESDTPPSGAVIQHVTTPDTSVTVDLMCGATYFFVIRLQVASGAWSNFSTEAMRIIDCGRPGVAIIISLS